MSTQYRSKKSTELDLNALVQAIKICSVGKQATRSTAKAFSIPRSTLQRYKKKVEKNFIDVEAIDDGQLLAFVHGCNVRVPTNQVFSAAQENDLVEYILKCDNHYYGVSVNKLRELAYQFAVKLDVAFPNKWHEEKKAGFEWYRKFKRRHSQLNLRMPEQTSKHETPITPEPSSSVCRSTSLSSFSILNEIAPKKLSNRGDKTMREEKKAAKATKAEAKATTSVKISRKRRKKSPPSPAPKASVKHVKID